MSMQPDPYIHPDEIDTDLDPATTGSNVVNDVDSIVAADPRDAEAFRRMLTSAYEQRVSADAILVGLVGLVFATVGVVAGARAGFNGALSQPVVEVLGFRHTALLALLEMVAGGCLLLCAGATSRPGSVFVGTIIGIAALAGAAWPSSFDRSLALEPKMAQLAAIGAGIVVLSSLVPPLLLARRSHRRHQTHVGAA